MSLESFQAPVGGVAIREPASGVTRSLSVVEDAETEANMEKSNSEGDTEILNPEHAALYDTLEASMDRENSEEFLEATAKSCKRRRDDQDPPSPPPKDLDQSKKQRHDYDTSTSKQSQAQTSSAWKTSDIREAPSSSSKQNNASQSEQPRTTFQYQMMCISQTLRIPVLPIFLRSRLDLTEIENNCANAIANAYKDPEENKLIQKIRDMRSFIKWYCKRIVKSKLSKADLEGPAFKVVRPFHKNNISFQFQMEECHLLLTNQIDLVNHEGNQVVSDMSKPLPLGGLSSQVTIQPQYFFNKDLEYLVSGDKDRRNALSISKIKAAYYQDFRLEELVSSLWIKSVREYDISAAYGISHWWFKRKEFYITRYSALSDHCTVRSHMKILNVVNLKTFLRYSYTFLREFVLRRSDYKDYKISQADFKNLHPNDFEDLYMLHL
uniref:Uncharacterized protein n=1 Tax=Tanacetum cinerariifolium TaxID=118510 RepID=A0A6L2J7A1_TANCI|nr:hypothetical protein [Tanacetum cinerariifolium]